jgi:hypothetical protein
MTNSNTTGCKDCGSACTGQRCKQCERDAGRDDAINPDAVESYPCPNDDCDHETTLEGLECPWCRPGAPTPTGGSA